MKPQTEKIKRTTCEIYKIFGVCSVTSWATLANVPDL